MIQSIKKWYSELPPWAQGVVTTAEATAIGFIVQWISSGQPFPTTLAGLKQFGFSMLLAVGVALRNLFKQNPLVTPAKP